MSTTASAFVDKQLLRALRVVGDPAGPLPARRARRPGQDRTVVPHRAGPVPRRDRLRPRTRRPGRAEHAVHRLGGDRLPPPGPLRDRADPAGDGSSRATPPLPPPRRSCGRRSCGRSGAPSPRPRPSACTATPTKSTPPWSAARSSWCSTRSTSPTSRSAGRAGRWAPAVPHRIGRHVHPKARPDDTTPPRRRRPGSTTCAWSRHAAHRRTGRTGVTPYSRALPDGTSRSRRRPTAAARRHRRDRPTADRPARRRHRASNDEVPR